MPFEDLELSDEGCVIVLFAGAHHRPSLRTKDKIMHFDRELRRAVETNVKPEKILKVPQRARDPVSLSILLKSVDEKIEELIQSL